MFYWSPSGHSLEQLAARGVIGCVNHLFQNPAEVQRKPAQRKDEDQAEDGLGHLPPLQRTAILEELRGSGMARK